MFKPFHLRRVQPLTYTETSEFRYPEETLTSPMDMLGERTKRANHMYRLIRIDNSHQGSL
jgi:hypothetical protein